MKCPACNTALFIAEDQCMWACRGPESHAKWLGRCELEKKSSNVLPFQFSPDDYDRELQQESYHHD
ncbi:MAG: hypothetical protein FDX18_05080 [Chlorobium sp.]|nr:MAG: hypothetical protein FDX18_05080 [Chlorobium sp.]